MCCACKPAHFHLLYFVHRLLSEPSQCQKATHPLLPTQPFLQQPLHQRVVVEQPVHTQPQPKQQPKRQLLFLQELQPQLIVELHLRVSQSQPEPQSCKKTKESQTVTSLRRTTGLARVVLKLELQRLSERLTESIFRIHFAA